MAKRKRRSFTPEYKAEVVGLVRASGKSVCQVARELDLTETAVRAWVKQAAIDGKRDPQGPLTSEERAELTRLRREMKTVTMERDFLRKAAAPSSPRAVDELRAHRGGERELPEGADVPRPRAVPLWAPCLPDADRGNLMARNALCAFMLPP